MDQLHKRTTDDWPSSEGENTDDALLDAAIQLPAEQRMDFIDRMCGTDEARRRELLSLIDAHESARDFLQTPALGVSMPDIPEANQDELIGATLGSYRIVARIGSGGMGAVYLAERADRMFQRQVAIKIIKRGMDTEEVLDRFRRERELLAGLDHPNIARLLDGGATRDGTPYLVMEHVVGTRIDRYCDERRLSFRDRLTLFRQTCEAVQHAHQRLIVHRDLKPSNILVTEGAHGSTETRPAVKLLDFGIARVLTGSNIDITATGARFLTPRYGSPEQLRGEPVSTSTDVYSLGVILYELLTGRHPYASANGEAAAPSSSAELVTAMQTTEPPRPSTAVMRDAQRGADGEHLRRSRQLAGDLDTIVMKAIEKEPERRYASVSALAEDLARYLAGEPIAARSPGMAEQARRFVRRNPALTGIVTAAAIGLILTAVGTSVGFIRATAATREARAQQVAAEQFGAFLTEMLASVSPHVARGRDTTLLREILHSAEERLNDEQVTRAMPPEALVSLHNAIGSTYRGIGDYEESQRRYESGLELSRAYLPSNHPATFSSLLGLANTLTDAGQHPSAAPYAGEAHAVALALYGRDHADTASALNAMASALNAMARISVHEGRFDEAEGQFREALDAARRASGGNSLQSLTIMNNIADLLNVRGRYAEAESIFAEVAAVRRQTLPPDHPDVLVSINNLAKVRSTMGDMAGAAAAQREVLEIRRRVLGPDHDHVATALMNIAVTLHEMGDMDGAIETTREAIDIYRRTLDPDHPWIAKGLSNLGVMLAMEGHLEEAEQLHREALEMRLRRFGPDHAEVAMSLYSLGALHAERGEFALARERHLEALATRRRVFGDVHPHVAFSIEGLGRVALDCGDLDGPAEARRRFGEALEIRRALFGERHALVARSLCQVGEALTDEEDFEEAMANLEEALAQQRELLPDRHRATGATLRALGLALARSGRAEEAMRVLEEAREIDDGPPLLPAHLRAKTHAAMGEALAALGDDARAEEQFATALALMGDSSGDRRTMLAVRRALIALYERNGRHEEAEQLRSHVVAQEETTAETSVNSPSD